MVGLASDSAQGAREREGDRDRDTDRERPLSLYMSLSLVSAALCQSLLFVSLFLSVSISLCSVSVLCTCTHTHTHNPPPHPHLWGAGHSSESRIPTQWGPQESGGPVAASPWFRWARLTHRSTVLAPAPRSSPLARCKLTGAWATAAPRTDRGGGGRGGTLAPSLPSTSVLSCSFLTRHREQEPQRPQGVPKVDKEEENPILWPRALLRMMPPNPLFARTQSDPGEGRDNWGVMGLKEPGTGIVVATAMITATVMARGG